MILYMIDTRGVVFGVCGERKGRRERVAREKETGGLPSFFRLAYIGFILYSSQGEEEDAGKTKGKEEDLG